MFINIVLILIAYLWLEGQKKKKKHASILTVTTGITYHAFSVVIANILFNSVCLTLVRSTHNASSDERYWIRTNSISHRS